MNNINNCSICQRITPEECLEKHHLIPASLNKRNKYLKIIDLNPLTIDVCNNCGNQIHLLFSEKELAEEYNSLEKLLANEKVQTWVRWIQKKKDFSVCGKTKKKK